MPKRAAQLAPDSAVLDAMRSVLDASPEPIAVSKLKSILKGPLRRGEAEVVALLEAERSAGRVFRYAPYSGKSPRYGRQSPEVYARQLALAALARKAQTLRDVEQSVGKRLKDYTAADWKRLVEQLVAEKAVFPAPGPTARSAVRYSLHPPDPRDYLRSVVARWRRNLDQIAGRLADFGIPSTEVTAAALEMLGDAVGRRPASGEASPLADSGPSPRQPGAPADFASRFDAAFARIDRQRGSHNFVSLVELRRALADVARADFDQGMRDLRMAGRYELSGAESLGGLRPEEREAAILEAGNLLLYVSRRDR
ncbi:MAG: hypothetical protein NUV77_11295 [Thermoguttaceae bacterium]|jgi:hypothetical protein|nr:hypothetical protein [Thermoguttaceae bacterium]